MDLTTLAMTRFYLFYAEKLKSLSADITVISANPQKTAKDFLVNSVKNFDLPNLLKTISDSEILISGGGSLLQDVTSLKSLLYYSFVLFSALVMRKDVIIFAQWNRTIKP